MEKQVEALADTLEAAIQTDETHPSIRNVLIQFRFGHLPPNLAARSAPFAKIALSLAQADGDGANITWALRKLVEAKDAAVRCGL